MQLILLNMNFKNKTSERSIYINTENVKVIRNKNANTNDSLDHIRKNKTNFNILKI